jgi:hypothetical protein
MSVVTAITAKAPTVFEVVAHRAFERPPSALIRDDLAQALMAEDLRRAEAQAEAHEEEGAPGPRIPGGATAAATASVSARAMRISCTSGPVATPVSAPAPGRMLDVRV